MSKVSRAPRIRTKFNKLQQSELELLYQQNNKPNRELMLDLGSRVGLDLRIIQVWFQNRRVKERNARMTAPGMSQSHNLFLDFMHMPACDVSVPIPSVIPSAHLMSNPHSDYSTGYSSVSNASVNSSYSSQYSDYIFGNLSQSSQDMTISQHMSFNSVGDSLMYSTMSGPPILTQPQLSYNYTYSSPSSYYSQPFLSLSEQPGTNFLPALSQT